jgi:predicted dinucleotide-binding enzyme
MGDSFACLRASVYEVPGFSAPLTRRFDGNSEKIIAFLDNGDEVSIGEHMRVGILGSGLMGGKLGTLFARAGHDVVFSYSRSAKKLQRLAKTAGVNARAGTPAEATSDADALLLAVHWTRVDDVLAQVGTLSGKTVLTCSLPMSKDDSRLVIGHTTSGAETLAAKIPRAHVVCAFSTVPSEVLFSVFETRRRKTRPDLVYCGDNKAAKKKVVNLIRDIGFHPVDVGSLSIARYTEPFSLLAAQIAYSGSNGPAVAYRFEYRKERKR